MCPNSQQPHDNTKWTRIHLEAPTEKSLSKTDPTRRAEAERQTANDLRKSIQQLMCDVHEEVIDPIADNTAKKLTPEEKQLGATKRMVSMMGRVALEHERSTGLLIKLTRVLVWPTAVLVLLTAVIIWLTVVLIRVEPRSTEAVRPPSPQTSPAAIR